MQISKPNYRVNAPEPTTISQQNFNRGVISLINDSKLPKNALKSLDNHTLAEDGAPTIRPGVDWFGVDLGGEIDGGTMHVDPADDTAHLVTSVAGTIKRSTNDGATFSTCTGGTFTAGHKVRGLQANEDTYLFNGYDNIIRYNGTTTLDVYTALTTPSGNVPTKTGLAGTTYTYRYRVSAVNNIGYTVASTAQTVQVDRIRAEFDDSNYVTFTWGAVTGAVRYDIYVGQTAGEEVYIDSTESALLTYQDKGQAVEQVQNLAPEDNTTQGPRVSDMELIGSRIYATGDRDFPYRVWISGAGRFIGQFSSAYEATYIDLQEGSQFKPVKVEDYRDGKGDPLATVWCKSKDGLGCVWQGTLESFTIGDVTFPVPSFFKLPGSRGTDAPDSVVNVLNDYMYYNQQAFYNLGSRAQFLNLLSTDEASANIRPDVKNIHQDASSKIAAHFQDAKVYFSVPLNSSENDTTMMFDTEQKAWLPKAFDIGFAGFFTFSDVSSNRRLLCWKEGDTRFSEISEQIQGDYGEAFGTNLETGLIHVDPQDRGKFIWLDKVFLEFAQPQGTITAELLAIKSDEEGFESINTITITPDQDSQSWDSVAWDTTEWDAAEEEVNVYSEPTVKRFFRVDQDINAYQIRITTEGVGAQYILRTIQVTGTATQAGMPLNWEVHPD